MRIGVFIIVVAAGILASGCAVTPIRIEPSAVVRETAFGSLDPATREYCDHGFPFTLDGSRAVIEPVHWIGGHSLDQLLDINWPSMLDVPGHGPQLKIVRIRATMAVANREARATPQCTIEIEVVDEKGVHRTGSGHATGPTFGEVITWRDPNSVRSFNLAVYEAVVRALAALVPPGS